MYVEDTVGGVISRIQVVRYCEFLHDILQYFEVEVDRSNGIKPDLRFFTSKK